MFGVILSARKTLFRSFRYVLRWKTCSIYIESCLLTWATSYLTGMDSRFTWRPASWFSTLERLASQIFLQTVAVLNLIPQMRLWEFEIGLKRGSISNEMTKVLPSR